MNRNSLLYKILKPCYDGVLDAYCWVRRKPYISQVRQMIDDDTSIITSNCFAGRIMQDLGMKYNTPTLGLYFMYPDYIEFLQHLEYYLTEAKIQFVEHSKYPLGDERRADWTNKKHWYPIGLLDGKVEVHFLHYHSEYAGWKYAAGYGGHSHSLPDCGKSCRGSKIKIGTVAVLSFFF